MKEHKPRLPVEYLTEAELHFRINRLSLAIGHFDRAGELRLAVPLVEKQAYYQGLLDNNYFRPEGK